LHAALVFLDESGFSLVSPLKRTWAPRGQTPRVRTSLSHWERVSLLGAVQVTPDGQRVKLHTHTYYKRNLTGLEVIAFLEQLLREISGPIVLAWDNHPTHRRKLVQAFLADHPRLHVYAFPRYAPELNPAEYIWTQLSEHTAGTAPHHTSELRANVRTGVAKIRRSQRRLWACIWASELPWKR